MLTIEQLQYICSKQTKSRLLLFLPELNKGMEKYEINTNLRMQHFLAQVAHESGCFTYVKEIASGKAYEGRKDLGNLHPGDGIKFKGRGLIQVTGHNNYLVLSHFLFNDSRLLTHPEILEEPEYAVLSAI
jgi:putative chitinase